MKTLMERASHLLELAENSQKELARIAGVKPPSVNDWLSGKSKSIQLEPATSPPSAGFFTPIEKKLGAPIDALLRCA